MSRSWKGGSTRAWRRAREPVLLRDKHRCRVVVDTWCPRHGKPCPGVCTGQATQVHHTRGRAITGDDPRFMVAACRACNLHVGDPTTLPDPPPRPRTRW